MDLIRKDLESYADSFPQNDKKMLVMVGKVGLGKTFLLNSVCRRIASKPVTRQRSCCPTVQCTLSQSANLSVWMSAS